jgi:NAD(P)-dependent dehydrogenase (short-subunit alcohol dehydrogenase family)
MKPESGKVVVITGTSSGFGLLLSVALAQDGYQVVATMRDLDKRGALLEAAERAGAADRIHIKQLDVTDAARASAVMAEVVQEFGRIDALVNNAGIAVGGFVEDVPLTEWHRQFDTNVFGVVACIQAVLPYMRQQQSGTIVNVSSASGRIGYPGLGPYTASKFALEGLTESLRLELLPYSIYVTLVEPGPYQTAIWEKSLGEVSVPPTSAYRERAARLLRQVQRIAKNAGNPDEVVDTIRHILSVKRPRLRYPVGRGIRTMAFLKGVLPWSWIERAAVKRM